MYARTQASTSSPDTTRCPLDVNVLIVRDPIPRQNNSDRNYALHLPHDVDLRKKTKRGRTITSGKRNHHGGRENVPHALYMTRFIHNGNVYLTGKQNHCVHCIYANRSVSRCARPRARRGGVGGTVYERILLNYLVVHNGCIKSGFATLVIGKC